MAEKAIIQLHVTTVTRKASSEVSTIHYTYKEKKTGEDERESTRTEGAEWEEIGFVVEHEDQPTIQIANVTGGAFLIGQHKLVINDPKLFGIYKVGDIIEFMPKKT